MFDLYRNVEATELPTKTTFIPTKDSYFFNVQSRINEDGETIFRFCALVAPFGTPEEAALREIKFRCLEELTVNVDGNVFDANSEARSNMTSKLATSKPNDIIEWKMHDNTWVEITYETLQEALAAATEESGNLRKS